MNQITLTINAGNFADGFNVIVETPLGKKHGKLPPCPQLPVIYKELQENLNNLNNLFKYSNNFAMMRGDEDDDSEFDDTLASSVQQRNYLQECQDSKRKIETRMKSWLSSPDSEWTRIREFLIRALGYCKDVVIETNNIELYKLPWHVWDILEDSPGIELTFAPVNYRSTIRHTQRLSKKKPRILAVMGDDTAIDPSQEFSYLQELEKSGAIDLHLLEKPTVSEFFEELRDRAGWDMFVFIGHSKTEDCDGIIYISESESVKIDVFKNSVREAASNGLQLAIFNSCQGLGIATNLADLQVPAIIVMREPVPNRVAQKFFKEFLKGYSSGKSLTTAVRGTRSSLEAEDLRYWPSSTWLPMIFRNPTVELPLWKDFGTEIETKQSLKQLSLLAIALFFVTAAVFGARSLGWLEPWELKAYDWAMRLRIEPMPTRKDDRILVIEITEEDIRYQKEQKMQGQGSLSEDSLEKILQYLQQKQARIIGLDIYRNFPVSSENTNLAKTLRSSDNLFVVCKGASEADSGTKPPPEISDDDFVTFSDVVIDQDQILRRHLLAFEQEPNSLCQANQSFSIAIALQYLSQENIEFEPISYDAYGNVKQGKLGSTIFDFPSMLISAYQNPKDKGGSQMMLNYRTHQGLLTDIVESVTLRDILENRVEEKYIKDRIVLIGVTSRSVNDYWQTPYSTEEENQDIAGVFLQAQMISQILSAVLDDRPLILPLPRRLEIFWIGLWLGMGIALGWYASRKFSFQILALFSLSIVHIIAFSMGLWVPLIPPAMILVGTLALVQFYQNKQKANSSVARAPDRTAIPANPKIVRSFPFVVWRALFLSLFGKHYLGEKNSELRQ